MISLNTLFSKFRKTSAPLDPERDWIILLIVSFMALACIVVWNAWAFDTVASGGVIGSSATSTKSSFNPSSLDAIHKIFENRASEKEKYTTGAYQYVDPSF